MSDIAIIPARSGSKGLPDKNIRPMRGKPLLAYAIEAARKSGLFSRVFVSTDSERYAEIARQYGADVPFLRSEALASDTASPWDAVEEVLKNYEARGEHFTRFALLQPTSPLRTAEDLIAADEVYRKRNAKAVVAVCEAEHPLNYYNLLGKDGSMTGFLKKQSARPRQMDETYYRINGVIYLSDVEHFRTHEIIYDSDCYAYVMDQARSIDIDRQLDFDIAEYLMEKLGICD